MRASARGHSRGTGAGGEGEAQLYRRLSQAAVGGEARGCGGGVNLPLPLWERAGERGRTTALCPAYERGYTAPMTKMSPIESEFATAEDAAAHDEWARAKIARALDSAEPTIPHDEVMAEARAIVEARRDAAARLAR